LAPKWMGCLISIYPAISTFERNKTTACAAMPSPRPV
jgi:hypothetical protein